MTITFDENADTTSTMLYLLAQIEGYTIDIAYTEDTGYPGEAVSIVNVDRDGVTICETDEIGQPIRNATWQAPIDIIDKITIL